MRLPGTIGSSAPVPGWPAAEWRGDQLGIRCVFMRGGTSRGAILRAEDMPADPILLEKVVLAIYGSPDVRQVDGLGGAHPLTSKVGIVGACIHGCADVDFKFGQVRINEAHVDFSGSCGNLSAAIGPYAIDAGLVHPHEPTTDVRIHAVNNNTTLTARVPVRAGFATVEGDEAIAGVPGTGGRVLLEYGSAADTLGKGLLPTGRARESLTISEGEVEVSIIDVANPVVFINARSLGLTGTELPPEFNIVMLDRFERLRAQAAHRLGLVPRPSQAAAISPAIPKVYLVSSPASYRDSTGERVQSDDVDVVARGFSMGLPHQAYAGTVALCTAGAAQIPGTVVNEVARPLAASHFRIGHPSGTLTVEVSVKFENGSPRIERAAMVRTARRIMEGTVYIPASRVLEPVAPF